VSKENFHLIIKDREMARLSKKQKNARSKVNSSYLYSIAEASSLVKDVTTSKFDASVDLAIRLGVDPKKANQMVRGVVTLPHGTGKTVRVLALVTPDKEAEAKEAGADYIGLDEYLQKIKDGWTDVDVIVTMPSVMGKLGPLGRILGPRGLMPNPKTGTVTMEIKKKQSLMSKEVKLILKWTRTESFMPLLEKFLSKPKKLRKMPMN
jgi:large subunit ribosomal protein L1